MKSTGRHVAGEHRTFVLLDDDSLDRVAGAGQGPLRRAPGIPRRSGVYPCRRTPHVPVLERPSLTRLVNLRDPNKPSAGQPGHPQGVVVRSGPLRMNIMRRALLRCQSSPRCQAYDKTAWLRIALAPCNSRWDGSVADAQRGERSAPAPGMIRRPPRARSAKSTRRMGRRAGVAAGLSRGVALEQQLRGSEGNWIGIPIQCRRLAGRADAGSTGGGIGRGRGR